MSSRIVAVAQRRGPLPTIGLGVAIMDAGRHPYRMWRQLSKAIAFVALMGALTSCSKIYDINLSLRNGRLYFTLDDGKPVRVQELTVIELSRVPLVTWELRSVDRNGRSVGDLGYGLVPSGMTQKVSAKPLRLGQLYRVEMGALDGAGSKEFVVSPEPDNGQSNLVTIVREVTATH